MAVPLSDELFDLRSHFKNAAGYIHLYSLSWVRNSPPSSVCISGGAFRWAPASGRAPASTRGRRPFGTRTG